MFFTFSKILTFTLDPLIWLLLVCFFFLFKSKIQAKTKLIYTCCLFVWCFFSSPYGSNKLFATLENFTEPSVQSSHYEAVVVLSGMLHLSNSTEEQLEFGEGVERILTGIQWVLEEKANFLIISGGEGALFPTGKSESIYLQEFAMSLGVPEEKILIDSTSRNTYENAVEVEKIVQQKGFKQILLVTSAFHMFRAKGCFSQVGLEVDVFPVDYYTVTHVSSDFRRFLPSSNSLRITALGIHEMVGILAYSIRGYATY